MGELAAWRTWWIKRRWYERNRRPGRRWRINRHMARAGAFIRYPIEGEVLEALDAGRLTVGENTLFEPGCWLTFGPGAEIHIGRECFLNRGTMLAAHRHDDPHEPITRQGFEPGEPVRIGSNVWFGVNCVVTPGVVIGDRAVIGANSVVTKDVPAGTIAAGVPAKVIREIEFGVR